MERKGYIEKMVSWSVSPRRKPLLLEGARQVGKTWLMRDFAKRYYKNTVYLQFDRNQRLRTIFNRDFDISRILHELEILFKTRIDAKDTILLFDEIQACRNALTSLKYFCEDRSDIVIIAAGSLLGLTYRDDGLSGVEKLDETTTGFPVGKVNTLSVHPMTFLEFLAAIGEERLASEIEARNWPLLADFHEHLADLLRHYYVIGGMPEAVQAYVDTQNFIDVRRVHSEILTGYRRDISKHAPKSDVRKIQLCWDSIPVQLSRENKKFTYSTLLRGGRASQFRDPLAWLEDAGLVGRCDRAKLPQLPLDAYGDCGFKIYALDVGLLATMAGLAPDAILDGTRIFREFKGALTEQFVFQQLVASGSAAPHYWSTDDSRTEVDFILPCGMDVVPLEVKSGGNVRSQSLKSYINRFHPRVAFRASMLPYEKQKIPLGTETGEYCRLCNLPLYAAGLLGETGAEA